MKLKVHEHNNIITKMSKKIALVFGLALASLTLVHAQNEKAPTTVMNPTSKSKLEFSETSHDFGEIIQGDKVSYVFKFKNTGSEPLVLSNVMTTCGCTATSWPRQPIPPNGSGEIAATFNSAGKMGKQNKYITVVSNASNGNQRVNIICYVKQKIGTTPGKEMPSANPK